MRIELETVTDEDGLYRRIFFYYIKNGGKVSSAAYKNKKKKPDPEPSVDLARLTTPEKTLEYGGMPNQVVGEMCAKVPLDLGFTVEHRPDAESGNIAHCLILGNHNMKTCKLFAEATEIVLDPREQ